nr:transcriptional regulator [Burkholderia contaminans]
MKNSDAKAFQNFDNLPSAATVSGEVVAALCGCHIATVWRRVQRGCIPKPVKIGGAARWKVGELRTWLTSENDESNAAEQRGTSPKVGMSGQSRGAR